MMRIRDVLGPARNIFLGLSDGISLNRNRFLLSSKLRFPQVALKTSSAQSSAAEVLPRLPVPPLQQTLDKYIMSVEPLITAEEFEITKKLVKDFGVSGGCGEKLQALLEDRANSTENWLSDWWLHTAYLDFRSPVVVYSSPGFINPLQKFKSSAEQLHYTAKVIAGALDYKVLIDNKLIPTEKMGKDPLDMSQYNKVFGTCRIPGEKRDRLTFADSADPPQHIIVAHNNHFFKVHVWGDKEPLNVSQIVTQLEEVVDKSQFKAPPIGILTTEHRNTWGKAYKRLNCDVKNRCSLYEIQTSLFLVCLDGPNPDAGDVNLQTAAALELVHGGGSKGNSANRWFDKTVQFVVGCEGGVGITYEHSPAEGPPIANLADHVVEYIEKAQFKSPLVEKIPSPKRLEFVIPDDVLCVIETAESNLDQLVDDVQMDCFTFKHYGKDFIKSMKHSPDSYIQMAIQFAFFRLHNEPGAHYESASSRKFIHGRTETIRSCSNESVAFACAMLDENASNDIKVKALAAAIKSHKAYTIDAVNGKGVDRHLLGLKLIAIENGMDIPKLYLDTGFIRSNHFRVSTSQVAAKSDAFMAYGAGVPDGYACCYNPRPKEIVFGLSAYRSSPSTDANKFHDALISSLKDMHDLLLKSQSNSKL